MQYGIRKHEGTLEEDMELMRAKILLIDDDQDFYIITRSMLSEIEGWRFDLKWVSNYEDALEEIQRDNYNVYLLDYSLGERNGIELLKEQAVKMSSAPFIMLTGQTDHNVDLEAMKAGAADYLVKGKFDISLLERSLRYAIERHRLMKELRAMALEDELTGIYNRRGFFTLARQHLKIADRKKDGMFFLLVDVDDLKSINDSLGHLEGDRALVETAALLKNTFRNSDIIARIGGDEFAALALETSWTSGQILEARLQENVSALNAKRRSSFGLSLSVGIARYDPTRPCSIEELLARADSAMYGHKRAKKAS